MSGFWDKLKDFFIGGGGGGRDLRSRVLREMLARARRQITFTAGQVAAEACRPEQGGHEGERPAAEAMVQALWLEGVLAPFGYSQRMLASQVYMYSPVLGAAGATPGTPPAPPSPPLRPAPAPAPAPGASARAPPKSADQNAYAANPEILGLSEEEMRKRALRINPMQT
ncbi:MAG TPA: hypothetical protein VFB81_20930, partial [Myxococcales bacterium]|nr:hypothetical protein [Myxococcales bacterium]